MAELQADKPTTPDGKQYHLQTGPGDLASHCLLVGDPGRAKMAAEKYFTGSTKVGDHRGLISYTGLYHGLHISVVTTGMGGPSTGIVLPEAVRSGGRRFIRVGSCSVLQPGPKVGESAISEAAVRLGGASYNWAPPGYPAYSNWQVVSALVQAAKELQLVVHVGVEASTDCFNEGQARPDDSGYIPPRLQAQHDELVQRGVLHYSMEADALFVWCSAHGGYWAGAINAIYGQRHTNEFRVCGEEDAALIALEAQFRLNQQYPL